MADKPTDQELVDRLLRLEWPGVKFTFPER